MNNSTQDSHQSSSVKSLIQSQMVAVPNPRFIFNKVPQGLPIPGETTMYDDSQLIDPESVDLKGGFLVKLLAASIDPYMRNRMRPEDVEGEVPAFQLGGV